MQQVITILGSTGSIGSNTLQVINLHRQHYRVFALTGHKNVTRMLQQCIEFKPQLVVMTDAGAAEELQQQITTSGLPTQVLNKEQDLALVAQHPQVTTVVSAIVGASGLAPTMAAAKAGKRILLANKEALVAGGELLLEAVKQNNAILLPVDSEHSAIFQCLPADKSIWPQQIDKLLLTASGGAFLDMDLADFAAITPEQACQHPNFVMGRKITVDSATMVNKALEIIEAKYLFNVAAEQIEVLIHPQQVIHSMVQYLDGAVLAQLGASDMRVPIAVALAYPQRITTGVKPLDFTQLSNLTFTNVDPKRFPAFSLVWDVLSAKSGAAVVFNAANEMAVAAFLAGQIKFTAIAATIAETLDKTIFTTPTNIDEVLQLNTLARSMAAATIKKFTC